MLDDVFLSGDTVNTASRMESSGKPGHVHISQATYDLVKDCPEFDWISRGRVLVSALLVEDVLGGRRGVSGEV